MPKEFNFFKDELQKDKPQDESSATSSSEQDNKLSATFDINSLPDEILLNIISYAENPQQLIEQLTVSRHWQDLINDPIVWKEKGYKDCHDFLQETIPPTKNLKIVLFANAPDTVKQNIMSADFPLNDKIVKDPINMNFTVRSKNFLLCIQDTPSQARFTRSFTSPALKDPNIVLLCAENQDQLQRLLKLHSYNVGVNQAVSVYVVTSELGERAAMENYLKSVGQDNNKVITYHPTVGGVRNLFNIITAPFVTKPQPEPEQSTSISHGK